jgi:hypothetical protein
MLVDMEKDMKKDEKIGEKLTIKSNLEQASGTKTED